MRLFITIICALWLAGASLPALSQVMRCTERMQPIPDELLPRSIDELKTMHPDIAFQRDDQPCLHAKETAAVLSRTLERNYLGRLVGYEFAKIVTAEGYFTIERFRARNPAALQKLATALTRYRPRKLRMEANTRYDFFMAGDSMVMMISSATGGDEHAGMFQQVRQSFSTYGEASAPIGSDSR